MVKLWKARTHGSQGLKLITPAMQHGWPPALVAALKEAEKNKEGNLYAKIEVGGGTQLYENPDALNTTNLVFEEGPAFTLPLKVTLSGPFLEKLGGGPCTIGNETTPVMQDLTTETSSDGSSGQGEFLDEGNIVILRGSRLGDFGWTVPEGAFPTGCGGAYESYIDDALDATLGLTGFGGSADHGVTILQGTLYVAFRPAVQAHYEG